MAYSRPFSLAWQEILRERLEKQKAEEELKKLEEQDFNSLYKTSGPEATPIEEKLFEPFKNLEKETIQAITPTPRLSTNRRLTLTKISIS